MIEEKICDAAEKLAKQALRLAMLATEVRCNFCGKTQREVRLLIASDQSEAKICNECVGQCVAIIAANAKG